MSTSNSQMAFYSGLAASR